MSDIQLIDTHCHLDFHEFDTDREAVLARCHQSSVRDIVIPAVAFSSFERTIKCCRASNELHLALGLHPVFIDQHQPHHLVELDSLLSTEPVVAVGEIGLDFYIKDLDQEKQIAFFTKQLIIAKRHGLPVIIHNRKAHDLCIELLAEHKPKGGIIHAFNGSLQQGFKYADLGFKLGFGGMLTFDRSNKLKRLAAGLPLDALVLETDAPDMTVSEHKGARNSPEYIPLILKALVDVREESAETIALATSENARQSLNLPTNTGKQQQTPANKALSQKNKL